MVIEQHTDAHLRWAIQMASVDSLKWRGHKKLSRMLGAQTVEHSYTTYCKIWCDHNDEPLRNPETGDLYEPAEIRAWLNPGAMNPRNGDWTAMRFDPGAVKGVLSRIPSRYVDAFNQCIFSPEQLEADPYRLGVLALYGDNLQTFDDDFVMKNPITPFVGDEIDAEREWNQRLQRADSLNKADLDYDLRYQNCHTATCFINGERQGLAQEFTRRRFLRWGANSDIIDPPEIESVDHLSLLELRKLNLNLSMSIYYHHMRRAVRLSQSMDVGLEDPWLFNVD